MTFRMCLWSAPVLAAFGCAADAADAPSPRELHSLPISEEEAAARALYPPGYELAWPVEFAIRVSEPVTQHFERGVLDRPVLHLARVFAPEVVLTWGEPGSRERGGAGTYQAAWSATAASTVDSQALGRWLDGYLGQFARVERARLKIKEGRVPWPGRFQARAQFEIAGPEPGGALRRDHGWVSLELRRTAAGWRIVRWQLEQMESQWRDAPLYVDVTNHWLAGTVPETRAWLTEESTADAAVRAHAGNADVTHAASAHPSVAVLDADGDGWDDLLVWDVSEHTALLHNTPDSTASRRFVDGSVAFTESLRSPSAVVFADLDNDGHRDVVVGRYFGASEIRLGTSDHLLPLAPTTVANVTAPAHVASVSLADINRDGRLDVLFATAGRAPSEDPAFDARGSHNALWLSDSSRRWAVADDDPVVTSRRLALHGAFADFDADGWPDLVVANDFAPAALYRNERGRFRDVTDEAGLADTMFAMGASWADFDGDGDTDLYVSQMDSSAGRRVTSSPSSRGDGTSIQGRRRQRRGALGSTLFRNTGASLKAVSGTAPFAAVRSGGWAYGAQFVDVDGDGWLDIVSPNGFFTSPLAAPDEVHRDS